MKMRTSLKKMLVLAFAAAVLSSCADYSKIVFSDFRVSSIDSLKYSLTDMRAIVNSSLSVDNPYFAMTFKDFAADIVTQEGEAVAEIRMDEGVELDVAAKAKTELEAPLRVHVRNPLKLLALGPDALGALSGEGYLVNYSLAVSKGGKFHKVKKNNVPLNSFIKTQEE